MNALALFLFLQAAVSSSTPTFEDAIVVSGIRADDATPVTKSNVERADIERDYHQQDIPVFLSTETPSINAYTESGLQGAAYSYITLRGVSPSRINYTLDGQTYPLPPVFSVFGASTLMA